MRNISNPLMTFWKWTYRVIEIIQSLRNSPAICPISKNSKRQSYFGIKIQEHLNPDTISRLYKKSCHSIYFTDENSGVTYSNEISKHSSRSNTSFAKPLWTSTDYKIRHLWISLRTFSHIIRKRTALYFDRLRDLDTKTLTIQIFLHRLLSYVQFPKSK